MSLTTVSQPPEPVSGARPIVDPPSSHSPPTASGTAPDSPLVALAKTNPRYLTPDQKRLRNGLYPEGAAAQDDPGALRLRIYSELTPADVERGHAIASAGGSIRDVLRALGVSRWTAWRIYREARPEPAPAPVELTLAERIARDALGRP